MTDPKVPRPYAPHNRALVEHELHKLKYETIPDTKRHASELDAKRGEEIMAMARAITEGAASTASGMRAIEAKLVELQVHAIDVDIYMRRSAWMRSPATRLLATVLGAGIGAYLATKGFRP